MSNGIIMACGIRRRVTTFVGNLAFGGRGPELRRAIHHKGNSDSQKAFNALFNSSMGFPGEGWARLTMATWNTRSLTFERLQYCKTLGYDILAITELWRRQKRYQTKSTAFITSTPIILTKGPNKGKRRFPDDKAAGVGILLSSRARQKLESFGSEGERICWARLKGPTCHLFIIAVYLPHRGRTMPSQDDTLADLEKVLKIVPQGDCICALGDFNEQLEAGIPNRTGKWTAGPPSPNSDKIMHMMQIFICTCAVENIYLYLF